MNAYQEFAFTVFLLMGAMMPLEKSLKIAQLQLSDKYEPTDLEIAKETVIKRIETGFES